MGHTTGHNSLGSFDDTLVLRWFSDARTCCEYKIHQSLSLKDDMLGLIFHSASLATIAAFSMALVLYALQGLVV